MSVDGLLLLSSEDNVAVSRVPLTKGSAQRVGGGVITMTGDVPAGFKVAIREIAPGEKIMKYGAPIGSATRPIRQGEVVHLDNMKSDYITTHARGGSAATASAAGGHS